MAKQHYFFKLIPPRPTLVQDMTDEERRLMDEHGAVFSGALCRWQGPSVRSGHGSAGTFGLGILEAESEEDARRFGEGDPSAKARLNKFEIYPMRVSAARAKQS